MRGVSKRDGAPLFNIIPLHAKNTSSYYGEGDKGDRVGKQSLAPYFRGEKLGYNRATKRPEGGG